MSCLCGRPRGCRVTLRSDVPQSGVKARCRRLRVKCKSAPQPLPGQRTRAGFLRRKGRGDVCWIGQKPRSSDGGTNAYSRKPTSWRAMWPMALFSHTCRYRLRSDETGSSSDTMGVGAVEGNIALPRIVPFSPARDKTTARPSCCKRGRRSKRSCTKRGVPRPPSLLPPHQQRLCPRVQPKKKRFIRKEPNA